MSVKQPFAYYGGKQRMAAKLVPLIPPHTVYVEPFAGGASLFWKKPWPDVSSTDHYREVLNDTNQDVVNFYSVLRDQPDELCRRVEMTPYSREEHKWARSYHGNDPVEKARAFFVNISQGFANKLNSGWGGGVFGRNLGLTWSRKCDCLIEYAARLRGVHVESDDALKVIKRWDSPQSFFYCDPPYPGTAQGHYSGYTVDDFKNLWNTLQNIQGSFLLSCYDQGLQIPDDWERFEFRSYATSSRKGKTEATRDKMRAATKAELGDRERTEVVWRKINSTVRPELQKLYDAGKYRCFTGYSGQRIENGKPSTFCPILGI